MRLALPWVACSELALLEPPNPCAWGQRSAGGAGWNSLQAGAPSRLPANCVPPGPARSHMPPQGMPGLAQGLAGPAGQGAPQRGRLVRGERASPRQRSRPPARTPGLARPRAPTFPPAGHADGTVRGAVRLGRASPSPLCAPPGPRRLAGGGQAVLFPRTPPCAGGSGALVGSRGPPISRGAGVWPAGPG